jgi:hypothetical protein
MRGPRSDIRNETFDDRKALRIGTIDVEDSRCGIRRHLGGVLEMLFLHNLLVSPSHLSNT